MKKALDSWRLYEKEIKEEEGSEGEALVKTRFVFLLLKQFDVGVMDFENDIRALPTVTIFSVRETESTPQYIKIEAVIKINVRFIGRLAPEMYIKEKLIPQINKLYYKPRIVRWSFA